MQAFNKKSSNSISTSWLLSYENAAKLLKLRYAYKIFYAEGDFGAKRPIF
jgi:hypothetical protein